MAALQAGLGVKLNGTGELQLSVEKRAPCKEGVDAKVREGPEEHAVDDAMEHPIVNVLRLVAGARLRAVPVTSSV
jgi:hypothetical protein